MLRVESFLSIITLTYIIYSTCVYELSNEVPDLISGTTIGTFFVKTNQFIKPIDDHGCDRRVTWST